MELEDGKVLRFRTAFTGETYALLCTHSTLLRAAGSADQADDWQRGFDAGVQRAAELAEGLLVAMFEARVQQLLAGRSRAWASGFLSGLLIAYEIDSVGRTFHSQGEITVIGDQQLAALYRSVLDARRRSAHVLCGDACAIQGLLYLADCLRSRPMTLTESLDVGRTRYHRNTARACSPKWRWRSARRSWTAVFASSKCR